MNSQGLKSRSGSDRLTVRMDPPAKRGVLPRYDAFVGWFGGCFFPVVFGEAKRESLLRGSTVYSISLNICRHCWKMSFG